MTEHAANVRIVATHNTAAFLEQLRSVTKGMATSTISPPPTPTNLQEQQYLDLVRRVLEHGEKRGDRTGVGTLSIFGAHMRFNLQDGFPLLTTKAMHWKSVVEELLWMIRGCTDAKELHARGVRIWDANGSREFLDKMGFRTRKEGDLGPIYGHQWRHFGATYKDCNTDYTGQGVDQLADVIHQIKTNPDSRRILFSSWNANDISQMSLPPCHVLAQFYVGKGEPKTLSCMLYQRSGDLGLGVPFNIASYALLTHMIAHICGLRVGEFIHTLGDAHVYSNHVEALRLQLTRTPTAFPQLRITRSTPITSIDDFRAEDLQLAGYQPQPAIRMDMAV